jgi:hypothetical protein
MFVAALGATLAAGFDAAAIIGRPLTPFSYAGVARRTARRSAFYGGAAYGAYGAYGAAAVGAAAVGAAAVGTAAAMSAMPTGCMVGVPCAGVVYQPVYQGTNVVYVPQ